MRWLAVVVAVLGLALVGAGCGGDDEASGDAETTAIAETTDTDSTTDDMTTEDDDSDDMTTDDDLSGLASEDCIELATASAGLGQAFAAPGSQLEGAEAFEELADQVPEEIRDDWQVLADAYSEYADALGDVDLSAGETPDAGALQELQQALASIDQPAVAEASESIAAWARANCPTG
jgi:hypothetical protein